MAAVKVTAMQHVLAVGVDDGVVVGAVKLIVDQLAEKWQAVFEHPDNVGGAADRIAVLQAIAVARALGTRQVAPDARGYPLHAGMRLDRKQDLVEMIGVAVERDRRHGRDARS